MNSFYFTLYCNTTQYSPLYLMQCLGGVTSLVHMYEAQSSIQSAYLLSAYCIIAGDVTHQGYLLFNPQCWMYHIVKMYYLYALLETSV